MLSHLLSEGRRSAYIYILSLNLDLIQVQIRRVFHLLYRSLIKINVYQRLSVVTENHGREFYLFSM